MCARGAVHRGPFSAASLLRVGEVLLWMRAPWGRPNVVVIPVGFIVSLFIYLFIYLFIQQRGAGRTSNALRRRPAFFNRRDGGDPLFLGAGCVLGWFGLLHAAKPKPPPPPGPLKYPWGQNFGDATPVKCIRGSIYWSIDLAMA